MNILDLFATVEWHQYLIIFTAIFCISIFAFRNCTFCFYDPGWINIFALSISVSLATYLTLFAHEGETTNLLFIISCFISFISGAKIAHYFSRNSLASRYAVNFSTTLSLQHVTILRRILLLIQLIIISLFLFRLSYQGLPILADDPEQAKVAINSSGFGLITRLVEPACSLSISISFFLWLKRFVSTQRMLLMLIPALTYSLSSGSKGALAIFLICYASVSTFLISKDLYFRPNLRRSFRFVLFVLLTLFAYAFLVLIRRGASESSPFEFALNTFGVRLLAFGDGAYYYFFNDLSTYIKHDYFDFFWGYAVAPILGFFRIAEYPITLGVRIANEMFGMEVGGPNPTFLVEAHVYFGLTVGWIYSFLIGFLFQYLRQSFIMMKYHFNAWSFLWITALYSVSGVVPVDMILFASSIFNYALLILLLWFVYSISNIVCSPAS